MLGSRRMRSNDMGPAASTDQHREYIRSLLPIDNKIKVSLRDSCSMLFIVLSDPRIRMWVLGSMIFEEQSDEDG